MNSRTDEPPYRPTGDVNDSRRGLGSYHKTISYLTKWRVTKALLGSPFTYTQIYKQTGVHRNELRKILDLFIEKGYAFKHELAAGVLEEQKGRPIYYILNFEHQYVYDILVGNTPTFFEIEYRRAKKATMSLKDMKKYYPVLSSIVEYRTYVLSNDTKLHKQEGNRLSGQKFNGHDFYEMTYANFLASRNEEIQEHLKTVKELEESISSLIKESKRKKDEAIARIEQSCTGIASIIIREKGLTVWDALIMCACSFNISKETYLRIWKRFKHNYPIYFEST